MLLFATCANPFRVGASLTPHVLLFATCANPFRVGAFVSTVLVGSVGACRLEEIVYVVD